MTYTQLVVVVVVVVVRFGDPCESPGALLLKAAPVSVICIQESWLDCNANIDLYRLNNYNLISKGKYVSEHGGLLIYQHVDFE